jgi:glutamine amidotransferase
MGIPTDPVATTVGIVDVGIANLGSIERTLREICDRVHVVKEPTDLKALDRLILPGVGAFPIAMKRLEAAGLADGIRKFVTDLQRPTLGICLGMQLLATEGEEHETTAGLNLIEGRVRRFRNTEGIRIPHVGWNSVEVKLPSPVFRSVKSGNDFYFVHSYVFDVAKESSLVAIARNGEQFSAAVASGNVVGVQFHPEKSSRIGRVLLRNFCEWSPC